jgi:hypothetical protein
MPYPSTTVTQAGPSTNTVNQLTLNSTLDVQTQATVDSNYRQVKVVAGEKKASCHNSDTLLFNQQALTRYVKSIYANKGVNNEIPYKELIDSCITDMQSKISDPVALDSHIRLLNKIKSISFPRICGIFNDQIPVDKPRGLDVFLNKLTLFIDAMPKTEYYMDNKKYTLELILSYCFIKKYDSSLKIENIQSFMQLTDEQIIKDAQDKELFVSILQGEYPNRCSQNTIEQVLHDNLPAARYAEIESIYPQFLDEFKRVCKNKKISIHYTFVNIIKKFLSNQDLPAKNILQKILCFLNCIDDNNPYIDTSIIYKLFGFYGPLTNCKLVAILKFSPQILEQIAKNPQLIQYAQQCKDGVFALTRQQLEDKNIIIKVQADHNVNVDQRLPESVIAECIEIVAEGQPVCNMEKRGASVATGRQVRNTENLEASIESKRSHNLTITKQIEEVINNCHQDKANILGDLNVTICSTCIQKNISMKDGLLDIFRTLSKKYISCKDAESISTKLKAVVKNLPDNIKIENTDFLNIICGNGGTGYINGLLALKECSVDEMIEAIKDKFRSDVFSEKYDLVIGLTEDIQDESEDKSNNTPALTREISAHNKRPLDNSDNFPLDNKRFKK